MQVTVGTGVGVTVVLATIRVGFTVRASLGQQLGIQYCCPAPAMQGAHTPSENGCGKEQDGILKSLDHFNLSGERIVDKNCEIYPGIKKINSTQGLLYLYKTGLILNQTIK